VTILSVGKPAAGQTWSGVKKGKSWSGVKKGQSWSGVKKGQSWSGVKSPTAKSQPRTKPRKKNAATTHVQAVAAHQPIQVARAAATSPSTHVLGEKHSRDGGKLTRGKGHAGTPSVPPLVSPLAAPEQPLALVQPDPQHVLSDDSKHPMKDKARGPKHKKGQIKGPGDGGHKK
jgi:hypothetical protein